MAAWKRRQQGRTGPRPRRVLKLVLLGDWVPDGDPLALEVVAGDGVDGERVQPLKPASKTVLGYLVADASGELAYEPLVDDARAAAVEQFLADLPHMTSLPPSAPPADHARFHARSTGNLFHSNPRWEELD